MSTAQLRAPSGAETPSVNPQRFAPGGSVWFGEVAVFVDLLDQVAVEDLGLHQAQGLVEVVERPTSSLVTALVPTISSSTLSDAVTSTALLTHFGRPPRI